MPAEMTKTLRLRWLDDTAEPIAAYNRHVETHGTFAERAELEKRFATDAAASGQRALRGGKTISLNRTFKHLEKKISGRKTARPRPHPWRAPNDFPMAQEMREMPRKSLTSSRVASVSEQARRVWKSNGAVRQFMYRPHPLLEGRRPIDLVLESEDGAEQVRQVLGRLEAGTTT